MGRLSRPGPFPGGVELGGADDGDFKALGVCPTLTGLNAEAVHLILCGWLLQD